jgi:hypothetical protein
MSDRDDLDTRVLDLDLAFDRLGADVDSHTRARGAERAIRSANHRRLAAAAGALAVAVVLVGVLVGTLGLPSSQSVPPVATPVSDPLPEPRAFDVTAFNKATRGWTSGWTADASPVPTDPRVRHQDGRPAPCAPWGDETPALDSSSTEFSAGPRISATHTVLRYDSSERAMESFLRQDWWGCQGELSRLPDEIWSGGESNGWAVKTGHQMVHLVIVVHERELAVLYVVGAGALQDTARKPLIFALLADLRI